MVKPVVQVLRDLVACDTRNPPRSGAAMARLEPVIRANLGAGFQVEVEDLGQGCISFFCYRGRPKLLFNVHLDTVPIADGWTRDPHVLEVDDERAFGLGACDIKGAAAALLVASQGCAGDAAFLFSTDEEAGSAACVDSFVKRSDFQSFEAVVVAEPTEARAILAHRGIGSVTGIFSGRAGHASEARALADNALHEAVRWASRALAYAQQQEASGSGGLTGVRFNLGRIQGGQKANMIAGQATVRYGLRPAPGRAAAQVAQELMDLAHDPERVQWQPGFMGPSLPAEGQDELRRARALAQRLGLEVGEAVDFWTEASLFSAAGTPALVYGPGGIAQAHTADEWVSLDQLEHVTASYERLIG